MITGRKHTKADKSSEQNRNSVSVINVLQVSVAVADYVNNCLLSLSIINDTISF